MIDGSIATFGYGLNGNIWEVVTFGFPIDEPSDNFILNFTLLIDRGVVMELIR
jgi:hypothetical protein